MKILFMAWRYLCFLMKAKTRHAVHSPFVYDFITKVLEDHSHYKDYDIIERQVRVLRRNHNIIETVDFGAVSGKPGYVTRFRKVNQIALQAGISRRQGRLLYRIVAYYKPENIIELGSSVGISTMYQAKANPKSKMKSIEGCASTAAYAQESIQAVNAKNVSFLLGRFEHMLPRAFEDMSSVDYAFVDGNHSYAPTLEYFNQLLPKVNNESILVFHDIHWSRDMERAWKTIQSSSEVILTIDLFFMGLVFFRKELTPQHFMLRF
ncbi:MAG: class I SAM-dependent methyltransferase [Lentimicrobium sp.]|nr:class I SAM-dependent methyltransferase [Lentimicrobium sp.]MDD2527950.1 class I SAM-dependent methyltransferase [Lentimicrobiaceae bacterium]MDD4598747.1 class I SAM-dependent methyltransferase [Lentimicrobiaceae bacterium]MDY0026669.1 class I SAM-dependent methyltransferase [Lentimicrobium sp.]HAH58880.1 SAM-dependent methyltransferase [Bacteroidales bacterium]